MTGYQPNTESKRNELSRGSIPINEVDNGFYDSDYKSDVDEGKYDIKNHRAKNLEELQMVKISNLAVDQTETTINNDSTTVLSKTASEEQEIEEPYEEWNPDSIPTTGSKLVIANLDHQVATVDNENESMWDSNGHAGIKTNDAKFRHKGEYLPDWDDDIPIERTVSVSSNLVDAPNNSLDSVWSPDIHFPGNQGRHNNLTKNILFRANSTTSIKRLSLNDSVFKPPKGEINTFEESDCDSHHTRRHKDHSSEKVASQKSEMSGKAISDNIEHMNLMDEILPITYLGPTVSSIQNDKTPPISVSNNIQLAATASVWLSDRQRNEIRKATRVTPIHEVNITHRSTIVDIEPVIGSDRIGRKFPFLNLENDCEKQVKLSRKSFTTNAWSRSSKTKRLSMKVNQTPDSIVEETSVTVTSDTTMEEHSDRLRTQTKENSNQMFYGFGIGRFRKVATNWLNKLRMKRNNVKLVNSKWD